MSVPTGDLDRNFGDIEIVNNPNENIDASINRISGKKTDSTWSDVNASIFDACENVIIAGNIAVGGGGSLKFGVGKLTKIRGDYDTNFGPGGDGYEVIDTDGAGGEQDCQEIVKDTDENLYLAQPKLFYYNPKYSINIISDINNIGEVSLSRRDIRGFGGGFTAPSRRSGTSIDLGDNSLNFLTNQRNALRIENKLASANFSYSPKKTLDFSGFFIFNNSQINSKEISAIRYTNLALGIPDEETNQTNNETSTQSLIKLSLSFKPNLRFASIKPNLLPQSKRSPSNSKPNKPGFSINSLRLSVN